MDDGSDTIVRPIRLNRRAVLRGVAAAGATSALGALLAACGGSGGATDTPKPAATGSTGASGTTAPAATSAPVVSVSGQASAAQPTAAPAAGTPKKGGTLRAANNLEVATLDPLTSGFGAEREMYYNMYDSLVAIDKDLKIIPALAEKWEVPDPKTYIFSLRKDVKFHDGTDFNAEAVKWNLDRYLTDKTSRRGSEISSIQAMEVTDPSTLKITLKAPFASFLANLVDRAGMMLSPKAVQAGGADFSRKPVGAGTGAFKFVEWINNDHLTMERNPNYWKKDASGTQLPYLDKVIFRPITDETVLLTNLKTGDLDAYWGVPAKDIASIKSGNELVLKEVPGLNFYSIELNTQTEPFNKKELRQAVAEALDRDQINKTVYFGTRLPGWGPIPPSSWAFDPSLKPYGANIGKAKEYLKAGGKPDGFTFEYKLASGSPVGLQFAQLVKDQLAKVGITLNITQLEAVKVSADSAAGNFQATDYNWSGRIDPDGNTYNQLHTGGGLSDTKYSNPQVDDLLDKARATTDQAQRKDFYQQAQKIMVDDAPMVWWGFAPAYLITRPNVQGMQLYPDFMMRFDVAWLK
ncbi:MAG: ABC transporter substrate-binding protein [Chloroflexota bacterium]|nr:ABC transporter substrate-binding protein [Chloroflexota bacterium]